MLQLSILFLFSDINFRLRRIRKMTSFVDCAPATVVTFCRYQDDQVAASMGVHVVPKKTAVR